MSTEFIEVKNEDIFNNIDKLKLELYDFKSLFELEINKLLDIVEIYNNKKSNKCLEDKKLKIGVMGQVNSGKSSFLNALIFNGENILSRDCIPKTKIITKINYSNTKRLEIEFYSKEEWNEIKEMLIEKGGTEGISLVKEILKFINASEQELKTYINKNNEIISFENYEDLLDKITQHNNKYYNYTFPIKAINIYIDDVRLKNIEIIDTPGVNDSDLIRKYTIDKCLKYVDVIFFLSQASIFLDNLDVCLILNQIPMESASNVFLIASKYDNAIIDEGWKFKNLAETDEHIRGRLTNRARKYVSGYISNSTPIFMSSMANNLALKKKDKYNEEESYIIDQLNNLWHGTMLDREKLMSISNFDDIKSKINYRLYAKENLIFKLKVEIEKILYDIKEKSKEKIHVIENSDVRYISVEQENIKLKSQKIYKGIEEAIEETKKIASNEKKQFKQKLEFDYGQLSEIQVRKKNIKIENENPKDNIKWYDMLFKKEEEEIKIEFLDYECIEIVQVINNINDFASNADICVKDMIDRIMDFNILKENILKVVCENIDENNEKLKINDVRDFIENSLCKVKLYCVKINVQEYIEIITSKFKEETIGQGIEVLKVNFKAVMKKIYKEIGQVIDTEFQKFMFQLDKAQIVISKYILEIMNDKIENLKNESYDLDRELQVYKKIIRIIDHSI